MIVPKIWKWRMKAILLLNASRQSCLIGMGNCSGNLELSSKVLLLGVEKNEKPDCVYLCVYCQIIADNMTL